MKPKTDSIQADSNLLQAPTRPDPNLLIKWTTTKYPERSQDMMDWLISYFFWRDWDDPVKQKHLKKAEVIARANAHARLLALDNTNQLGNVVEESIVLQLLHAQRTRWTLYEEISDIKELIQDRLIDALAREDAKRMRMEAEGKGRYYKPGGKAYEYQNLLAVVDTLESMGVPKEDIIPVGVNFSKAVRAAPIISHILENNTLSEDKRQEQVHEVLQEIADPEITVVKFEENARIRSGKTFNLPDPAPGSILLAPEKEVLIIETSPGQAAAIKGALKGIVNFSITDAARLIRQISQIVMPKSSGFHSYQLRVNGLGPELIEGNGVQLPSPEEMERLILRELAQSDFAVRQMLARGLQYNLPIYPITTNVPGIDIIDDLAQAAFVWPNSDVHALAQEALKKLYYVPMEATNAYNAPMFLEIGYDEAIQVYGIFLQIVPLLEEG